MLVYFVGMVWFIFGIKGWLICGLVSNLGCMVLL